MSTHPGNGPSSKAVRELQVKQGPSGKGGAGAEASHGGVLLLSLVPLACSGGSSHMDLAPDINHQLRECLTGLLQLSYRDIFSVRFPSLASINIKTSQQETQLPPQVNATFSPAFSCSLDIYLQAQSFQQKHP